jgi:hypothetical protein
MNKILLFFSSFLSQQGSCSLESSYNFLKNLKSSPQMLSTCETILKHSFERSGIYCLKQILYVYDKMHQFSLSKALSTKDHTNYNYTGWEYKGPI